MIIIYLVLLWFGTCFLYGVFRGFKDYQKKEDDTEEIIIDYEKEDLKAHLEYQLQQLNKMGVLVEKQLETETDDKKRLILINKSMGIDNKTYKIRQQINALNDS